MRGLACESIGQLFFREGLPEPEPGAGEALIRVRTIGICGTDYHAFRGNQPFFEYPRILGHEIAGTIERLGSPHSSLSEGELVSVIPYLHCGSCGACRSGKTNCCTKMKVMGVHVDGGMRERIVVPISHLVAANGLTPDQCAMLEPLAIGAHAIRRSGLSAGDTALVVGAGPIGLGVMALARYAGAKVIAMDVHEGRLAYCRSWAGVTDTVPAGEGAEEQLRALTDGDMPSYLFDATGHAGSMNASFGYAAHGGTIVFVGLVKGDISFNDPEFHKRELTLLGSRNATREDFAYAREAIMAGYIDVSRYITHRCPFNELPQSFVQWLAPETGVIKAVAEL